MTVYYLPFNYKKVLLEAIQDKNKQIQNNKISKDASNSNNTTFDQKKKKNKKKGLIISDCTQLKFYLKMT